jgi:uncharacterized protein
MSAPIDVRNNESDHQFEANVDGGLALMTYHRSGNKITFIHTEVPEQSEGKGVASALAKSALAYAREQNLRVVAQCVYLAGYVKKYHDQYGDLLDENR